MPKWKKSTSERVHEIDPEANGGRRMTRLWEPCDEKIILRERILKQDRRHPYGDNVGFARGKPYDRPRKATERRAETTAPDTSKDVGQNKLLPPCVEEPGSKRQPEEESPQTSWNKSSLKARHIKSTRKARVGKFYIKGELLGKGGYGSVYAGTRISDGLSVALKYVRKSDEDVLKLPGNAEPLPKEVGLSKMVNGPSSHPNILELYDWFDRPASYVIAMERPNPCQDLFDYCQKQGGVLKEDEARNITRQLLGTLQHCHDSGVVHRDVKPENILIQTETKRIKLIDFGCGDPLKDTPYTDFSGTECYLPLEWFEKQKFLAGPGTVWSVGVMLYHIVCGGFPFTTFTRKEMRQVQFRAGLSEGFKDIVRCCLRPRAEDRPTLEQLQLHSWLRQSS